MWQDIRSAVRQFRHQPGVMGMAIIGLALALAVNTVAFGFVDRLALRTIGVSDPESVVTVSRTAAGASTNWTYAEFAALRARARLIALEAWIPEGVEVSATEGGVSEGRVPVRFVTGRLFETFDWGAEIGRVLRQEDDAATEPVAVLQHAYWKSRFNADPGIVGRTIQLAGVPVTVVGVTDKRFTGIFNEPPAIWISLGSANAIYSYLGPFDSHSTARVQIVGRVQPAATIEQVQAETTAIARAIDSESAESNQGPGAGAQVLPMEAGSADRLLQASFGIAIFTLVLVLGCVNVANLLLAGATERRRELATRVALGATRGRLCRMLVIESVVLALAAGAAGLPLAVWLLPTMERLLPVPPGLDIEFDVRVFCFMLIGSIVTGLIAGVVPARYGTGRGSGAWTGGATLSSAGRGSNRLRSVFLAVQATAALLLVVLASLFARASLRAASLDLGFDLSRVVEVRPTLPRGDLARAEARVAEFLRRAPEFAATVPGVDATALAMFSPFGGATMPTELRAGGGRLSVTQNRTSASYFRTMDVPILRGRSYTTAEVAANAPVVVLAEDVARRLFGRREPLGAIVDLTVAKSTIRASVIGIARPVTMSEPSKGRAGTIFRPLKPDDPGLLLVRTRDGGAQTRLDVLARLETIDPEMRLRATAVIDNFMGDIEAVRTISTVAIVLAALALALAIVGLFGVAAFVARQQLPDIGVRMALGATAFDIQSWLLWQSLRPVAIGLAIGLAIALAAGHTLASLLYGFSPRDPIAMVVAVGTLALAAGLAAIIPARRAAASNPARVLRQAARI